MGDVTRIRRLERAEVQVALDWAAAEGWNPGVHDGDAFFAADPDGFFGLDLDGELAVTVSVVRYDPDVPVPNADGSALARDLGFEPVFETARMYRGPDPCLRLDRVFGVTSFELG